jgi:cellulose synthase (UDP-forming)
VSWETALFQIIRWPWDLYGSVMGVATVLRRRSVTFRVTPKGGAKPTSLSCTLLTPYISVMVVTFLPTLLVSDAGAAKGYFFFLIMSQVVYVTALLNIVWIHCHEADKESR